MAPPAVSDPAPPPVSDLNRLEELAAARFRRSIDAAQAFFEANADGISAASLDMARRFQRGGRLIVFGAGADATDAQHVSVEFVHPVIVGKRALPAIALTNDVATLTASSNGFQSALATLGRPADIALGIGVDGIDEALIHALGFARAANMLVVAIVREGSALKLPTGIAYSFEVPGSDQLIAQEVGETLYHVFWELVHLFLDHGVGDADVPARAP